MSFALEHDMEHDEVPFLNNRTRRLRYKLVLFSIISTILVAFICWYEKNIMEIHKKLVNVLIHHGIMGRGTL
jgi:hypothetical protein